MDVLHDSLDDPLIDGKTSMGRPPGLLCWPSSGEQRCSIGVLASIALKALLHASFVADIDWLGFELNYVLEGAA